MLMFNRLLRLLACCGALLAFGASAQTLRPQAVQVAADVYMVQGAAALGSGANRNFISN
jgi:hypothetical protein